MTIMKIKAIMIILFRLTHKDNSGERGLIKLHKIPQFALRHVAVWSSGMILAPGARGPELNSRNSPGGCRGGGCRRAGGRETSVAAPADATCLMVSGTRGRKQGIICHDPGRTRTCNLWFRRPTPYPLGHRAPGWFRQRGVDYLVTRRNIDP